MIKILPNLEEGLQFVGFLKEVNELYCPPYNKKNNVERITTHYIAYKLENFTIAAMT